MLCGRMLCHFYEQEWKVVSLMSVEGIEFTMIAKNTFLLTVVIGTTCLYLTINHINTQALSTCRILLRSFHVA